MEPVVERLELGKFRLEPSCFLSNSLILRRRSSFYSSLFGILLDLWSLRHNLLANTERLEQRPPTRRPARHDDLLDLAIRRIERHRLACSRLEDRNLDLLIPEPAEQVCRVRDVLGTDRDIRLFREPEIAFCPAIIQTSIGIARRLRDTTRMVAELLRIDSERWLPGYVWPHAHVVHKLAVDPLPVAPKDRVCVSWRFLRLLRRRRHVDAIDNRYARTIRCDHAPAILNVDAIQVVPNILVPSDVEHCLELRGKGLGDGDIPANWPRIDVLKTLCLNPVSCI